MFKPNLNARQKQFIQSVVSRNNGENRPILEAIVKSYILNEGLFRSPKILTAKFPSAPKQAERPKCPEPDPKTLPDYASLSRALMFEKDCWDRDLRKFYENCELIKYYLSTYGIRDFNQIVHSEAFKNAERMGQQLDKMRINPLKREEGRRQNMHECLNMLNRGEDRALIEGILLDFDDSERVEVGLPPVMESREDNLGPFKEAMAGIANFMRRHGSYPWEQFLKENRMLLARANRFDEPIKLELPNAKAPNRDFCYSFNMKATA